MTNQKIKEDIEERVRSLMSEIKGYSRYLEIEHRITNAQSKIGYRFEEPSLLMLAFCRTKIPPDKNGYMNETLAQIGDFVLTLVIGEIGFLRGESKKEIQSRRERLSKNDRLYKYAKENDFLVFCYNEEYFWSDDNMPRHKRVSANKHDSVVEAIIGAIYLDGGLDRAREWILNNYLKNDF